MNNTQKYQENSLLSVAQAAELLGISRVALLKRIKNGHLKAEKVGRSYVLRYQDIIGNFTDEDKAAVDKAVKKAVRQYGEVFKKLGKE